MLRRKSTLSRKRYKLISAACSNIQIGKTSIMRGQTLMAVACKEGPPPTRSSSRSRSHLKQSTGRARGRSRLRHGHPSTLHLWWARRPLAACRAVLFAQFVDDPERLPRGVPNGSSCRRPNAIDYTI